LLSEETVATTNHRVRALRRYLERADSVNALIFGSSRAIAVLPAHIEQAVPGTRAHSFAVPAGTIEDHLPLLRWLLDDPAGRARALRLVVLMLDADLLGFPAIPGIDLQPDPRVSGESRLRFMLNYLVATPSRASLAAAWTALGRTAPSESARAAPAARVLGAANATYDPWPPTPPNHRPEAVTTRPAFARSEKLLAELVALCHRQGIRLEILVSPMSEAVAAQYRADDLAIALDRIRKIAPLWVFDRPEWLARRGPHWTDSSHYSVSIARMMIARVFADQTVELPADFGRRLE
jgi:hypothetical protein